MEFGDSRAGYSAFSRPMQMALPAPCLSVIAQGQRTAWWLKGKQEMQEL